MHSSRGKQGMIAGLALALAATLALPSTAHAGPDPEAKNLNNGRYRLFAGNIGLIEINRVSYGLTTKGEVGVNKANSSTVGGGYWPKGTGDQYMFNSGLQVAGIIAGGADNPWAGDTTGGMFFDASGLRQHGALVTQMFNSVDPVDAANWPQAAYVPLGDESEEVFDPLLRGRVSASQGDVWWMSTEADPSLSAARPHPLGIVAEYRVMGWNYPAGNEDLIYLILTFYNITSLNEADYAQYRPGIRDILIEQAQKFHTQNNATFKIDLPDGGYTIDPFYAAFAADADVSDAGNNFASVNLPFALGYAYEADFAHDPGWTFPPNIFGAPFFAGVGFVGMKYLKSATGPGEINLYSNTTNGGAFPDPRSTTILYKYMSGEITPADGVACNNGDVSESRICYVGKTSPADVRLMQSSTAISLAAGASASLVIAYIHAAPLAVGTMTAGTRVLPGDPTILSDANALATTGANRIDSLMGFAGYEDANNDGIPQQGEFQTISGSLLGKASVAQFIFDSKFLLPFSPDSPQFFLIPGDQQVTVVWQPSGSETSGDPYFAIAGAATVVPDGGGDPVPNALYDPNYRNFDVEGYRVYRGRVDSPTSLTLLAQYDYGGTTFSDYTGQVINADRGNRCAPEIPLTTSCNGVFDPQIPGETLTKHVDYDINEDFVQVAKGNRTTLAVGDIIILAADTAVTGQGTGFPALDNTGVPFVYLDNTVKNGIRYFYSVTAFDVNSITSTGAGNTSLESARITKSVYPRASAGNHVNESSVTANGLVGRGVPLTDDVVPEIDPTTGLFNKMMPPANQYSGAVSGLIPELLQGQGNVSIKMDSVHLGDANGTPHTYFLSAGNDAGRTVFSVPVDQSFTNGVASAEAEWSGGSADPELAAAYGGGNGYRAMLGSFGMSMDGAYYYHIKSRGCVNGAGGYGSGRECSYGGAAWFSGENQSVPNPWQGNYANFNNSASEPIAPFTISNVGALDGVATLMEPISYENIQFGYRSLEGVLSGAMSAADYKVYWGSAGAVDSVIDVTHNVPVPMTGNIGLTWGILNQANTTGAGSYDQRPDVLTHADFACVPGLKGQSAGIWNCGAAEYNLVSTAVPGTIAFGRNTYGDVRVRTPATNAGFGMYLKGHIFLFELEGGQLPSAGTVWTMRDYIGAVRGGNGGAGDFGPYEFTIHDRPFTAAGAELQFTYDVTNEDVASNAETLAKVHTVPDPYYVTSGFEATTTSKVIKFVNLPAEATIRIYTVSGVLVRVLKQETTSFRGDLDWDVRNRNNQFVASGVYFYHVTAENGETTIGRMTIINYAQ